MYYNKRQMKRLQENRIPLIAFGMLMVVLSLAIAVMGEQKPSAKVANTTTVAQKTTPTPTTDPEEITNGISTIQAHFSNIKRLSDDGVKASQLGNIIAFCADKTAIDSEVENVDEEMEHLRSITSVPTAVEANYAQVQTSHEFLDKAAKKVC
jgi:hypothetical protein